MKLHLVSRQATQENEVTPVTPRALAVEFAEQLLQCKEAEPDLFIKLIIKQLLDQGIIAQEQHVPISTVHRLFKSHGVLTHVH